MPLLPVGHQEVLGADGRGDGPNNAAAGLSPLEDLFHLALEIQPVVEHHVGGHDPPDVRGLRLVEMRVNAFATDAFHENAIADSRQGAFRENAFTTRRTLRKLLHGKAHFGEGVFAKCALS